VVVVVVVLVVVVVVLVVVVLVVEVELVVVVAGSVVDVVGGAVVDVDDVDIDVTAGAPVDAVSVDVAGETESAVSDDPAGAIVGTVSVDSSLEGNVAEQPLRTTSASTSVVTRRVIMATDRTVAITPSGRARAPILLPDDIGTAALRFGPMGVPSVITVSMQTGVAS
jgi:hypothetical protein